MIKGTDFIKELDKNKGCAMILAGSDSDKPHIQKIAKSLDAYSIPFTVEIHSAHKQPYEIVSLMQAFNQQNYAMAYVAVAGGTDALSGTLSFHSTYPVISCPPDAPNNSCLTNPPGSSNVYIARPENVGKFVAQMYSHLNPEYKRLIEEINQSKIDKLKRANLEFNLE